MGDKEHIRWLSEGVEAWNNRREKEDFRPNFESEDLSKIFEVSDLKPISGINWRGINLSNANFTGAYIGAALFLALSNRSIVDLTEADFTYSDLTRAKFVNVDLMRADFTKAILNYATLARSDLIETCFSSAHLSGTRFSNCNLEQSKLYNARLQGAEFFASRPWEAKLYSTSNSNEVTTESFPNKRIDSIEALLNGCREFRQTHKDEIVLYFRGERGQWDLKPSVMRTTTEEESTLRSVEGEMLNDLMTRQPEAFSGLESALSQWVLAQHHGLKTRLLDITRNPLVALFSACAFACKDKSHEDRKGQLDCNDKSHEGEDGRLHVFGVPKYLIKPFNSDTVSVIANFAKLRRYEQNLLLDKTEDYESDDTPTSENESTLVGPELFERAKDRLYYIIRQERPNFRELIDVRDLYRVFVVEPQQMFERIRAQSGAFLISAFHERFERDEVLRLNKNIPIYSHYQLEVSKEQKSKILDDLRLLNVTRETLLPSIDETTKAITQQYLDRAKQTKEPS